MNLKGLQDLRLGSGPTPKIGETVVVRVRFLYSWLYIYIYMMLYYVCSSSMANKF